MPQETILSSQVEDVCIVQMPPALTVSEAVNLETAVKDLVREQAQLSQLILDLKQTQFIDSSGIGALVISRRLSQQQGWDLVLKNVQTQVNMALEMTDLLSVFTIVCDAPEPAPSPKPTASVEPDRRFTHPSVNSFGKRGLDILGSIVGLAITAGFFF
ncbi:anti-anti-sigma factor, partial [filamentous cyanobacterium CCP5]